MMWREERRKCKNMNAKGYLLTSIKSTVYFFWAQCCQFIYDAAPGFFSIPTSISSRVTKAYFHKPLKKIILAAPE